MLEVGIPPEKILMITFTKAAAQEMSVKFKKKFGEPNGITFSTIHALCLKILMTYGGLSAENIIKTSDQWKFLMETARKCQSVCDPAKAAGNFQMLYSAAMNNRMSPSEVNPKDIKGISRKDFLFMSEEYRRMKERTGYIDFDDMLVKAYELMTGNPQVLRQLRERWDYIQVDEYQDVNYLQRTCWQERKRTSAWPVMMTRAYTVSAEQDRRSCLISQKISRRLMYFVSVRITAVIRLLSDVQES